MQKTQKVGVDVDPELSALMQLRDEDIDTSDIPERTDWSGAVIGKFYRPVKAPITIRLDADVVAWLKASGRGYQTRINSLLRGRMAESAAPCNAHKERRSLRCRKHHFPTLEKNGELTRSQAISAEIQRRGSVFAPAA
jgi:uncharacterized protein (DUF4415 family)